MFNEFYAIVQDLKRLGKSEKEIARLFRQNGVTGVNELIRGKYKPLPNAAITIRRAMRREGTIGEYPRDEINKILREQKNRKFTARSVDKKEDTSVELHPLSEDVLPEDITAQQINKLIKIID